MTQAILTVGNIPADAFEGLMVQRHANQGTKKGTIQANKSRTVGLTDRELNDPGIGRSDIESIARGTFLKDAIVTNPNDNLKGWV